MNRAFEKILKKIEEKRNKYQRLADGSNYDGWNEEDIKYSAKAEMREELKEIVHEVAEEYNGGWIPCSERLPSGLDFVLYTHKDGEVDICSIEYFYDYLDKFTAWQPLPEPFQPKGG